MKAMQAQAIPPRMKDITRQNLCLWAFLFFLRMGMKKHWMAKAWPKAAASSPPLPLNSFKLWPSFLAYQLPTTQVMKRRQAAILTIPQAISVAPNYLNFMTRVRISRTEKLMMGFQIVQGGTRPYHCSTISQQYRMSMSRRLPRMHSSQKIFSFLLPLKCFKMAISRSGSVPVCRRHRWQEQQLMKPVMRMTMRVSSHPDSKAITGSSKISPPIIPLTMQSMAITPEMCSPSYSIDDCYYYSFLNYVGQILSRGEVGVAVSIQIIQLSL